MSGMLKRIIAVCMLLCALCTAAAAEFDLSMFEFDGEYKDMYTVTHEQDAVFIDTDFSAQEKSFSHKNDSAYYYSTFFADIIVLNYGRSGEYAVPRIWLRYCSEKGALHAKKLELTLRGKTYTFTIEKAEIEQLGQETTSEEILIRLGEDGVRLMYDWCEASKNDESISARLIGENDEISFTLPDIVADYAGLMWSLFADAGGLDTLDKVNATTLSVAQAAPPKKSYASGVLQFHDKKNNTVFDVPIGWALSKLGEEDDDSIVFDWSDKRNGDSARIVYVSTDLWAQMEVRYAELMKDMVRSDLDNIYTAEDFAAIYQLDAQDVRRVTRGSYVYFTADVEKVNILSGYIRRVYLNVVNGISYLLEYTGSMARIDDFEYLIESVEHFRSM